jgi:dTMP kinase
VARGRLITIEGIDGAGKTTLAAGLMEALRARGVELSALREPGGVVVAERIRALVMDPDLAVDPRAEALLYAAARAQLVAERLEPILADGGSVLLDLPFAVGRVRRGERPPDRLEREDESFFARIDAGYRAIAEAEPDRVRVLDASVAADVLLERALLEISDLWGRGR